MGFGRLRCALEQRYSNWSSLKGQLNLVEFVKPPGSIFDAASQES